MTNKIKKSNLSCSSCQIFLFTLFFLVNTSMGYGDEFSRMLKDHQDYSGSEYLKNNLSAEKEISTSRELMKLKEKVFQVKEQQEFEQVQMSLSFRKGEETKILEEVILKNGIFEPPRDLWKRLKDFSNTSDFENLLYGNYDQRTILAIALRNNRSIKKAYEEAKASLEKYNQVSNLDEILNQYSVFTKNLEIQIGEPLHMQSPVMNFPFPGMLALKGNIVEKEVLIARLNLENVVQDIITRVRESYYEFLYLGEAVVIIDETMWLLKRLREVINRIYTTGKSTLNDILKIQMEIDRIEKLLEDFKEKQKTLLIQINKFLDIATAFKPESVRENKPNIPVYKTEDLLKEGLVKRNVLKTTSADIERMELIIEMAEKKFYPDFTPGYSFFQNRLMKQVGTDAPEATFSTRPKVRGANWFGSNDAYIRETKLKYKALQEKLEELKNNTVDEITRAVYRYETAYRDYVLYKSKLVPQAETTIETTEALYMTGKADFLELIDSEERYLNYNLTLKKATRDMNIEIARIERLVGKRIAD